MGGCLVEMIYPLGIEKAFATGRGLEKTSPERNKQEPGHQDVKANGILRS